MTKDRKDWSSGHVCINANSPACPGSDFSAKNSNLGKETSKFSYFKQFHCIEQSESAMALLTATSSILLAVNLFWTNFASNWRHFRFEFDFRHEQERRHCHQKVSKIITHNCYLDKHALQRLNRWDISWTLRDTIMAELPTVSASYHNKSLIYAHAFRPIFRR